MKLYTVTCDDAATIAAADMAAVAARAESRERANKKAGERHARCERGHERTTSKGGNGQNRKIVGEVGKNNKRIKRGWKKKEKRGRGKERACERREMGSVETRESRRDAAIAALPLVSVAITRCTHTRCWRWCALFCLRQCASLSHPPLLFFKEEEDDNKRRRRGGGGWKFMKKRRGDTHKKKTHRERDAGESVNVPSALPFQLGLRC